jgi:putative oxidoreductase
VNLTVTSRSLTHTLLRIGIGFLFLQHGVQKTLGLMGGFGAPGATAPLMSLMGLAGILELGGGILLMAGLATRATAIVLIGEMLYAFATAHAPQGGWPIQNAGELPLLYSLVFAFLAANGAGPFSLDSLLSQRRLRNKQ